MRHESMKWIALLLGVIGAGSAAWWVMYDEASDSDLKALSDGTYLEYVQGSETCRLTFSAADDVFEVRSEPAECFMSPYSKKTKTAVQKVDARAKPTEASQVSWGPAPIIWIPPDKMTPNSQLPGSFTVQEIVDWQGFRAGLVELQFGIIHRLYYDTQTGFLVGVVEKGVDHEIELARLKSTNAK